jgi:hypothetical protein
MPRLNWFKVLKVTTSINLGAKLTRPGTPGPPDEPLQLGTQPLPPERPRLKPATKQRLEKTFFALIFNVQLSETVRLAIQTTFNVTN